MKSPIDFANEFAATMRAHVDRLKHPDTVYTIHNNIRRMSNQFDSPGPEMRTVQDFNIPNGDFPVPVRLYVPHQASEDNGPTLIYLHGGGFVTCSVESHEGLCKRMASGSGYRVLSVDYRLAPEYPYPAGPKDCEAALLWALEGKGQETHGINPDKISLGGDSAGGNMTAFLAQKYRDRIKAQVLLYPLMQLVDFKPPKPGPQDWCGLDPLRDEGKLYADNMIAHGVKVVYTHEKAMPHGFLNFSRAFPKAKKIPIDVSDFLRSTIDGAMW